jgi:PEP-CTERM motif
MCKEIVMQRKCLMYSLALASAVGLMLAAGSAKADLIYLNTSDFNGSRVTPDSSGVHGLVTWDPTDGGFKIAWRITYNSTTQIYDYKYQLTNADGTALDHNLSHWILQVSNSFTIQDLLTTSKAPASGDPTTYNASSNGNSNPDMPGSLFGLKFDSTATSSSVDSYEFTTKNAPVWGSFYAVDGHGGGITAAWNEGFTSSANRPTTGTTDFTDWIAAPDTKQAPPPDTPGVPEPSTLAIAAMGALGFLGYGLRRKAGKHSS